MRSLFGRLGPIEALVVLVWVAFTAFGLIVAPRLGRTYEAFDLEVPHACAWSLRITSFAPLMLPLPILFAWRTPTGTRRVAIGFGLLALPIVLCALSCWQWFRLAA